MSNPRRDPRLVLALLLVPLCTALHAGPLTATTEVENFAFVRFEGLTEIVGDLVITCTGGTPTPAGQPLPTVDFDVQLNTQVSSRFLEGARLEALILVDDPAPGSQVFGQNVFQAEQVEGGRIQWTGVLFDPPGDASERVLRFKNIRVDASSFDLDSAASGNIILSLSATGLLAEPLGEVLEKVGFAQPGLEFSLGDAAGGDATAPARLLRSHDNNGALFADSTADFSSPGGRTFTVRFKEKLETAFRRRVLTNILGTTLDQADPASPSFTETGFFNSSLPAAGDLNRAGLADHGTRLMASFRNVPDGVALFVTIRPVGSARFVDAELVSTNEDGANTDIKKTEVEPTSVADRGIAPVPITNGEGQAVWEVTTADFDGFDTLSFGVTVAYLRDGPGLGTAFVRGSFAPVSDLSGSSLKGPVPRFARRGDSERAFEITLGDACGVAVRSVVQGGLDDPLKDDIFAFDALTGTVLDLNVKARAGVGPVEVRLFDPALEAIDIGPFIKARGRATKLKGFPLFATGEYQVVLRSPDGSSTDYRLRVRGKLPKNQLKLKVSKQVSTPGEPFFQTFEAVAGSILNVTLKGKGTDPEILELREPPNEFLAPGLLPFGDALKPGSKTEKVKGFVLPLTGEYRLTFTGIGVSGILSLSIRVKAPGQRVLEECLE